MEEIQHNPYPNEEMMTLKGTSQVKSDIAKTFAAHNFPCAVLIFQASRTNNKGDTRILGKQTFQSNVRGQIINLQNIASHDLLKQLDFMPTYQF